MADEDLRERIRHLMKQEPSFTGDRIGKRVGCATSTAYAHMKAIREEQDIVDAQVEEDTVPKEKRMATKKQNGGGASSDDDNQKLLDWYEVREKDLLERIADLTARFLKSLDRIEELAAATTGEG